MQRYEIRLTPTRYPIACDYDAIERKAKAYGLAYHCFEMITNEDGDKILEHYHFDIEGKQPVKENFFRCYRGNLCTFLSHGKMYACVVGANLYHLRDHFGLKDMVIDDSNGIDIYQVASAKEIDDFLVKPMQICKYCKLQDTKTMIPFRTTKQEISEWT